MLFSRTYRYRSSLPISEIKSRLLGQHVKVHDLDFEVSERDNILRIIPHAERVENIKTLPITHVEMESNGNNTNVRISSKMRKIDKGGPMLIVSFCFVMIVAAVIFRIFSQQSDLVLYSYTTLGISVLIFVVFWWRMQSGYFDYVHKIRDYIKERTMA